MKFADLNDDELEALAKRAIKYRKHITSKWPTVEAVLHGMVAYWVGIQEIIGERNANRACGMYFCMYGESMIESTGGSDTFSYALASGEGNELS